MDGHLGVEIIKTYDGKMTLRQLQLIKRIINMLKLIDSTLNLLSW